MLKELLEELLEKIPQDLQREFYEKPTEELLKNSFEEIATKKIFKISKVSLKIFLKKKKQ